MIARAAYGIMRDSFALLLIGCFDSAVGFSFERVPIGGTVNVHFESRGCFHETAADLRLTRVADGLRVDVERVSMNLGEGWHVEPSIHLDLAELRRLDAGVRAYRGGGRFGCTTKDWVRIRWPNGVSARFTETLFDGSCAFIAANALPFGALLRIGRDTT